MDQSSKLTQPARGKHNSLPTCYLNHHGLGLQLAPCGIVQCTNCTALRTRTEMQRMIVTQIQLDMYFASHITVYISSFFVDRL